MSPVELPFHDEPRASIVVPAWRQPRLLRRCLASLAANVGRSVPVEVVVVLNGAEDEVVSMVRREVVGARVVSSRVNLGFAGGCNRGARTARGEYLVLINDDVEVEPGWLEALVATADAHRTAGAVGARVFQTDGSVQEAGCIVWADGTTLPVGRGLPPDSHAYSYLRAVDYCSACSLLVRRSTWDAIGGLDEDYFPAYYEDVDLCLAVRRLGQTVLYEPRARVRHHESASSDDHFKAILFARNGARLRTKWSTELARLEPAEPWSREAVDRAVQRARGFPPRVLVVDDRLPDPSVGSGFGRMLEAVRELSGRGWAVTLVPTDVADGDRAEIAGLGVEVVEVDLPTHLAASGPLYDAAIVSRPHNFERYASAIREHQPEAALVYDAEALFSCRLEVQATLAADPDEAGSLREKARVVRALEHRIAVEADAVACVSYAEAAILESVPGHGPIEVLELLEPAITPTPCDFADRRDIVYVAGWLGGDDSPNVDGLEWFVRSVLPLVRSRVPWVRLRVTGDVPPRVRPLGGPSVALVGRVPDLASLYGSARVAVVPVRYGAGVKKKTTEALQHGVPVVATTVGAEGIAPEAVSAIAVADDPAGFAAHLVRLLTDEPSWQRARDAAIDVCRAWREACGPSWSELIELARRRRSREWLAQV